MDERYYQTHWHRKAERGHRRLPAKRRKSWREAVVASAKSVFSNLEDLVAERRSEGLEGGLGGGEDRATVIANAIYFVLFGAAAIMLYSVINNGYQGL